MVDERLTNYVQGLLQRGYSPDSIRQTLVQRGFNPQDVEAALDTHKHLHLPSLIHFSHATLIIVVGIVIAFLGFGYFVFFSSGDEALLEIRLESVTTTVEPGGYVVYVQTVENVGGSEEYDVELTTELLHGSTGEMLTTDVDVKPVENLGSSQHELAVPDTAVSGDYLLRVVASYEGRKTVDTLTVMINAKQVTNSRPDPLPSPDPTQNETTEPDATCTDGIQNGEETGVDCGGTCDACVSAESCNDFDACTEDTLVGVECVHQPIRPCCGDGLCESGEVCSEDCGSAPTSGSTLDDIKLLATTDETSAIAECSKLGAPDLKDDCFESVAAIAKNPTYCANVVNKRIKDVCYSKVAKESSSSSHCQSISKDDRRDSCYLTFVLDFKDYSVCDSIVNENLRQSCYQLKALG